LDEHSHSNPEEVRVQHLDLDLELDFDARRARGSVRLDLERRDASAALVLDSQALEIEGVRGSDGKPRRFELGTERPGFGQPLRIELGPNDRSVTVAYSTTEVADAMQWLAPEQTARGRHPYLFTQGQAILTRTWIPLQDTPGVRATYEARIRAPQPLTAVMSAEQLGHDADGAWRFRMPQAIPSYLIALACGELEFRPISARAGVWAEPGDVDSAARELEDTEAMIAAAERLFGPYRWGRYDLLVLPPSFPYGGMENPRLTFATPTILAGDKSLVSLVAHELAHSWSGNLVTNATWRDFWLNEGFTVYFEHRIMEAVFGPERAAMEQVLALAEVQREMAELSPRDQVLHIDLAGRHPDDGFSRVPYVKGALFLRRLEEAWGRERFDRFLRGWFDGRAFQSVTTDEFRAWFARELAPETPLHGSAPDLDLWLNQPGLPPDTPVPTSDKLAEVDRAVAAWRAGRSPAELGTSSWVTQQWLHFIESLPADVDGAALAQLDRSFGFTASKNTEILCAWLELAIRRGYSAADERLEQFLLSVGRRKFLKPLYSALAKTEAGLARARQIYAKARPRYHAVSTKTIDGVLKWDAARAASA
jgi:leukotriene-A4 hydrolase